MRTPKVVCSVCILSTYLESVLETHEPRCEPEFRDAKHAVERGDSFHVYSEGRNDRSHGKSNRWGWRSNISFRPFR